MGCNNEYNYGYKNGYNCEWKICPVSLNCLSQKTLAGLNSALDNLLGVSFHLIYVLGSRKSKCGYNYLLLANKRVVGCLESTVSVVIDIFRSDDYEYSVVSITEIPCEK